MTEQKLLSAAQALPLPTQDYLSIEEAYKKLPRRTSIRKRILAAACIVLLLAGCAATAALSTEVHGFWVDPFGVTWSGSRRELAKFDYTIPKNLNGVPFYSAEHLYFSPPGTSQLSAYLAPSFKPTELTFANEEASITLFYGDASNPLCGQYWELRDGVPDVSSEYLLPGSYQKLSYADLTLYAYTHQYTDSLHHTVLWTDTERCLLLSLSSSDTSLEDLIGIAKEIIGQNRRGGS